VWKNHPQFYFVGHEVRFYETVASCLLTLTSVLDLGNHTAALRKVAAPAKRV